LVTATDLVAATVSVTGAIPPGGAAGTNAFGANSVFAGRVVRDLTSHADAGHAMVVLGARIAVVAGGAVLDRRCLTNPFDADGGLTWACLADDPAPAAILRVVHQRYPGNT
jgi:hypothetical protein